MGAPTELSLLVWLRRVVGLSIVAGTLNDLRSRAVAIVFADSGGETRVCRTELLSIPPLEPVRSARLLPELGKHGPRFSAPPNRPSISDATDSATSRTS